MKFQLMLALALLAFLTLALALPWRADLAANERLYTLELAAGLIKRVTEAQKWNLIKASIHFADITQRPYLHIHAQKRTVAATTTFPVTMTQKASITPLLSQLNKRDMQTGLTRFSAFHNRYYKSTYSNQASEWLLSYIQAVIDAAGASRTSVREFSHVNWTQDSIIASIPGRTNATIIVGTRLDSLNMYDPIDGRAPGADDDGRHERVKSGEAENTVEFHWYAAEEGELLGSQVVFGEYARQGRGVKAVLQQDLTGFVESDPETEESLGVVTDFVDVQLTCFVEWVITAHCGIPYVEMDCGYACSDHASASKAGFPSAIITESAVEGTNGDIHSSNDEVEMINFNHMLEHAKVVVGFAHELIVASGL